MRNKYSSAMGNTAKIATAINARFRSNRFSESSGVMELTVANGLILRLLRYLVRTIVIKIYSAITNRSGNIQNLTNFPHLYSKRQRHQLKQVEFSSGWQPNASEPSNHEPSFRGNTAPKRILKPRPRIRHSTLAHLSAA